MAERLLGYCTNVHAGATLAATRDNLQQYAVRVRQHLGDTAPLPVGLWLSAEAAGALDPDKLNSFRAWLETQQLQVFTLNGFPYSDFHQPVVKHAVYEPNWTTAERFAYTERLAEILAVLLPPDTPGSISSLPLGWGDDDELRRSSAAALQRLAGVLEQLEARTGREIHVALEPEPGCTLGTSQQLIDWYHDHLLVGANAAQIRRYVRVCHDVCHAAVMFEPQSEVIAAYRDAEVPVGKVQLSSAPRVKQGAPHAAHDQLRSFHEPRYLHQTSILRDGQQIFHEDLPQAIATEPMEGEWRVHFHVPIHLAACGLVDTTQGDIGALLQVIGPEVVHFEVETYAWSVLPKGLAEDDLAAGIASEVRWARQQLASL